MVLLPLVGGIWVILLIRVLGSDKEVISEPHPPIREVITQQPERVFLLKDQYRDPFLDHTHSGIYAFPKPSRKSVSQQVGQIIKKELDAEIQHEFRYHGAVSKAGTQKDITGILSIDGKTYMLGLGTSAYEVEVLEISMSQIRFRFDQKEYEVRKE